MPLSNTLVKDIRQIVEAARAQAYLSVNAMQIMSYWKIGQRIVEEEQQGEDRAEYGANLIELLAAELSKDYPAGFRARELRNYRQFYLYFSDLEIWRARAKSHLDAFSLYASRKR